MSKHIIDAIANKGEKNQRQVSFSYEIGDNIAAVTKQFGEKLVYQYFVDNLTIAVQARARGLMNKNGDKRMVDADIVKAMGSYVPKLRGDVDPQKKTEAVKKAVSSMSKEDRAKLIKELQAAG